MFKNDRRMFDRFEVDFSAEIKQPGKQQSCYAQCYDVSASGIGLLTEEKFIPNINLEIWLGIPDGHPPFRGVGRVVWAKQVQQDKWRSGLEFQTLDFLGLRRIFSKVAPKE